MSFYCYMLYTSKNQTYIGATVDPDRRLRQHNKELSGGARATAIRVGQGLEWARACYNGEPHCNLNGAGNSLDEHVLNR